MVALSIIEAEYISLLDACRELNWLVSLSHNSGIFTNNILMIYGNNQGSIALAANSIHYNQSKHINVKYHYIRDQVENRKVKIKYICIIEMMTNILTKLLL